MKFETGKTYQGYTVTSRTAKFVTFAGEAKRRHISTFNDGQEYVPNSGGLIKAASYAIASLTTLTLNQINNL
jgi:hypothetical protein